jgi:hypothetical protein
MVKSIHVLVVMSKHFLSDIEEDSQDSWFLEALEQIEQEIHVALFPPVLSKGNTPTVYNVCVNNSCSVNNQGAK